MEIVVGGDILIRQPPQQLVQDCLQSLRIKNPTYQVAIRKNPRARYALSEYNYYAQYDERANTLTLPHATLGRALDWCGRNKARYSIRDLRVSPPAAERSTIELREYQHDPVGVGLNNARGIFHLDTGSGKTIIALRLAELLQTTCLIIVPKLDLLKQFEAEYKKYFEGTCGMIQGKKVDIQGITIATVQSLRNRIKDKHIACDTFGVIMVDECHLAVTPVFREVLGFFTSARRYGFTGTMGRSDGQVEAVTWMLGPVIARHKMERAHPHVEVHEYREKIFMDEYHNIIEEQVTHSARNKYIYDIATQKQKEGRRVLILTKRVAHAQEITAFAQSDEEFTIFRSSDTKEERAAFLARAKHDPSRIRLLLGTYALLGTGIDIPGLDTLILAGDLKSDVLLEQSAGRILRLFDDKASPVIIDIHDTGNLVLRKQGNLRQQFYKEQGWTVTHFTTQQELTL